MVFPGDTLAIPNAQASQQLDVPGQRRLFHWSLVAATMIPFIFMPLAVQVDPNAPSLAVLIHLFIFLGGTSHVGLTGYYYADAEARAYFRSQPVRYIYVPIGLVLGTAVGFAWMPAPWPGYLLLGYFIWQTYHYQKQNWGALCFLSKTTETGAPLFSERLGLELAVIAGILGLFRINGLEAGVVDTYVTRLLYDAGLLVLGVLSGVWLWSSVLLLRRCRKLGSRPGAVWLRIGFFTLAVVFYTPTFIFTDPRAAVLSYALAHGVQYYVFMFFVASSGSRSQAPKVAMAKLLACGLLVGAGLQLMSDKALWPGAQQAIFGAYLGLVMTHFVVDGGVWRLSQSWPRQYLKRPFNFAFQQTKSHHKG